MAERELQMPAVTDGRQTWYGGDQDWCRTLWHRRSGCAPTAGADLCAYYALSRPHLRALYEGSISPFLRDEFTDKIEDVFRYITPSYLGFPYAGRFANQFCIYAGVHGIRFRASGCGAASGEQMFRFVKAAVDSGDPPALLILRHRAPELRDDNWHWVVVSGYADGGDGGSIIVSNCGERKIWPARMIFEQNGCNTVRLLRFREDTRGATS